MPDEVTTVDSTGTAEPAPVAEAPVETPGDSGPTTIEERHAGFLEAVEKGVAEDPKVEAPKEPEPKTEAKPEAKTEEKVEVPDAPDPDDEEDDDELELLDRAGLDKKFPNSPKGLRGYAAKVVEKYKPVLDAVTELGGVEAVKRLDRLQTLVMSAPDRPDHPDVVAYLDDVRKTNPQFASQLNTNVFYGALDENPALLDSVIKVPRSFDEKGKPNGGLGPNWNMEKLLQITQLVDDGEIDVDAVVEGVKDRMTPEERTRKEADEAAAKAREDARDAEVAELKKGQANAAEEKKQAAIKTDVETLTKTFSDARDPVLRQFKLLPVDGEPDEIRQDKEYLIKKLITLTSMELSGSALMMTINRKVESQQKGDDYNWAVIKASDAYKSKFREIAMREAKYFAAYLKNYNQPAAANTKERRPEPLVDGSTASPRTPSPTDEAQQPLSKDERNKRMVAMIEGKTGT